MTLIYYNNELTKKLGKKQPQTSKTAIKIRPFTTWFVAPVVIEQKLYYLYVEEITGFSIITKALTTKQFARIFSKTISKLNYLTEDQQAKIKGIATADLAFRYTSSATDFSLMKYRQYINRHPQEITELLDDVSLFKQSQDRLAHLSIAISHLLETKPESLFARRLIQIVNEAFPDKPGKPKPTFKYVTIKPHFDDPRKWKEYEWQEAKQNQQIVKQIQRNNRQMIKQYIATLPASFEWPVEMSEDFLDDFLNRYLLTGPVTLVTTSLAEANAYYYDSIMKAPDNYDVYQDLLIGFYRFLSKTGIIRKSDSHHIFLNLQHTARESLGFGNRRERATYFIKQLTSLFGDHPDTIQLMLQDIQDNTELPTPNNSSTQPVKKPSVPSNKTYEFRVKLNDFRPSTWRRFIISGDKSLNDLEKTIIIMFHGFFEHLYSLHNKKTNEVFELPEEMDEMLPSFSNVNIKDANKTYVSSLKTGDRLLFTYDFGDSWEFSVHVRKIINEPGPENAQVLAGKGYGIVEDIGGVGALQAYYDDYQTGHVDPDLKEWMGEPLIDLNQFDLEKINDLLQGGY